ncbi:insulinase family protein [soil metagenome]
MIRTTRLAAAAASLLALTACASLSKFFPRASADKAPSAAASDSPAAPTASTMSVKRPPKGAWAQAYSDIAADPAVKFGTLPNGMRYAIMKNATPKGQASVRLRFDAGSMEERDDQQGLAHFLEHMAFNGSKKVPEGEMVKMLERLGLAFGADTNASTGFTETTYQLDLPKTDDATVDSSLMLMRETASELLINQDAMDRERGVVLSEERTRDGPQLRVYKSQLAFWLPGHLANRRLPIGKVDILKNAPNTAIRDYYQAYYRPERATLIVVGDFDPAAMEAKVVKQFGDWKAAGPVGPEPALTLPAKRGPEARVAVEPGAPLALQMSWVSPPDLEPDSKAKRRHDLLDMLGFGIFNRRLERLGRSGEPPFIGAGAYDGDQFHSAKLTNISITAQPGRWREGLAAAEQEQRRLVQFGVRQDELDREIAELRTGLKARADAMATRRTPVLADELVGTLEDNIVQTNPAQDLAMFEEQVRGLTPAQVSAAMKTAFGGSGPLIFLSTPTAIEGGEPALTAAYNTSRAKPVTASAAEVAKTWPYERFGAMGKVADQSDITDLETVFVRFANGVRLTVKPTKFRDDEILVSVRFGDGRLGMPTDRVTAAWAAPSAFTEGGLTDLTTEELENVMRSKILSSDLSIDDDAFSLSGETRPEDLDIQLQLLAAYAVHPGWRPEAFQRMRTFGGTIHDQQDATPEGVLGRELAKLSHSGDMRWAFPTRAEIAASKPEDLQALMKTPLQSGPVEVVIVGDTTVEKAIEAVARTFGGFDARPGAGFKPGEAKTVAFARPTAAPIILTHKGRADQAIAFMAWPTDDFFADMQRSRTLRVLSDILDLRLIDEIREKQGTTYSPQVSSSASSVFKGYGFISANIEAQPEKMEPFFGDVMKIAADLRNTPVTQDELDRAKKPALEALEKRKQTNEFWLGQLSGAQADRRKLDAIRSSASSIQRVTAADIQAAAKTYLVDDKIFKVIVRPEAK